MKNLEQRVFRVVNLDPPLNENLCFFLTLNLDSKQATELQNAILWLYGLYQRMASQKDKGRATIWENTRKRQTEKTSQNPEDPSLQKSRESLEMDCSSFSVFLEDRMETLLINALQSSDPKLLSCFSSCCNSGFLGTAAVLERFTGCKPWVWNHDYSEHKGSTSFQPFSSVSGINVVSQEWNKY